MKYKLVCFDVDGTLVDNVAYSWQIFHNFFKTDEKKRELAKKRCFNGEITYLEWAEHDIKMWVEKGAKKQDFWCAMQDSGIRLMPGALETIKILRQKGYRLAIVSGTINIILDYVFPEYKEFFEDIYLSRLYFDKDGNISKIEATEFDMAKKADALKRIAKKEKISLKECVFIGDHHNDVEISKIAGLAIAFDAKDQTLREVADIIIDKKDLRECLKYID
jgi:phosphoserine phosphatase